MKKTILLFAIVIIGWQTIFSQNVGIGTTTPMARLDIDGDIATHSADINITNPYNTALDVNTQKQSNYKLLESTPAVGNFVISGISSGVEGRTITLANRSGYTLKFINEDGGTIATNRIRLGINDTLAIFNGGAASLKYDAVSQRWEVISSHYSSLDYFGGIGNSFWNLSGTDISNSNPGNVGIGGTAVPGYKLYVRGRGSFEATGLVGPAGGGAMEIASTDVTGQQSIKIDGQKIQSTGSSSILQPATAKNLLLNPYGGNVGIRTTTPNASLSVTRGTGTDGTAAFFGTDHVSHFNYSNTEETYIRGGKTGSAVYINDTHNGAVNIGDGGGTVNIAVGAGTANIGTGTGTTNIGGSGNVNIGSGGMYSAQTGGLNLVPLGVILYHYSTDIDFTTIVGSANNVVGNILSSSSCGIDNSVLIITLNYNTAVSAGYSNIITIGSPEFSFIGMGGAEGARRFDINDNPFLGSRIHYSTESGFGSDYFDVTGTFMIYGIR